MHLSQTGGRWDVLSFCSSQSLVISLLPCKDSIEKISWAGIFIVGASAVPHRCFVTGLGTESNSSHPQVQPFIPQKQVCFLCAGAERANTKVSAGGENKCCGKEDVFIGDAEEQRIPEKQLAGHKGICSLAFYLPNKSFQVKSLMRGQEKRKMIRYLIP